MIKESNVFKFLWIIHIAYLLRRGAFRRKSLIYDSKFIKITILFIGLKQFFTRILLENHNFLYYHYL